MLRKDEVSEGNWYEGEVRFNVGELEGEHDQYEGHGHALAQPRRYVPHGKAS